MGHGLGSAQKAIIEALQEAHRTKRGYDTGARSTAWLAEKVGLSPLRVRQACDGLAKRHMVILTTEVVGWQGIGEYGTLVRYDPDVHGDVEPNVVAEPGDPWPLDPERYVTKARTEFVHQGMPISGRMVWLAEQRVIYLMERAVMAGRAVMSAYGDWDRPASMAEMGRLERRADKLKAQVAEARALAGMEPLPEPKPETFTMKVE